MKYRLQSAVSIISLAIGFACFALASMWIKYETTYDGFHRDADRMYFLATDHSEWGKAGDILEMSILSFATPSINTVPKLWKVRCLNAHTFSRRRGRWNAI